MIDDETAFAGRDKCAVVGIGQTEFSRNSGRSVLSLATEASLKALADAGLGVDDIDGIVLTEDDDRDAIVAAFTPSQRELLLNLATREKDPDSGEA